jgi:hypothetical protein
MPGETEEKEEEWKKLYEKWGVNQKPSPKKHLILPLLAMLIVGIAGSSYLWLTDYFSPRFTSNFLLVEELPTFNSSDYSIKFDKIPAGFSCDVYISGPTREFFFISNFLCSQLKEKSFRVPELVKIFGYKPGDYILLVKSDLNQSYEMEFRVLP